MSEKIDQLIGYIERWSAVHPRRSLTMLSRLSGVAYPTLRRIFLKESVPTIENAMALLNMVASLSETIAYFGDNASMQDFCQRLARSRDPVAEPDAILHLLRRESFWILSLALTVGATQERVEKLLGAFGVGELHHLIEEEVLVEESQGIYRTNLKALDTYIESTRAADEVLRHIAEVPSHKGDMKHFLTFNVTPDAFNQMKRHLSDCFLHLEKTARSNPGSVMMAGSLAVLRIYEAEGS